MTKSIFTKPYERFRGLLVDARKAAGLTQVQLAKALMRPQSYVSKFERGERRLDVIEFLDIADALKFDPCRIVRDLSAHRARPEGKKN